MTMTTEAELYTLFSALKYHVDVDEYGTRRNYNALGQLHCEEGPAIVHVDGTLAWFQNGQLHRTDGPAVEWQSGHTEWWINGVSYTEQKYFEKIKALGYTP